MARSSSGRNRAGRPHGVFLCPNCGEEVRQGASSCPSCGSDETTGWADGAEHWEADIPVGYAEDDDFDYDAFVRREFPAAGTGCFRLYVRRVLTAVLYVLILLWLIRRFRA